MFVTLEHPPRPGYAVQLVMGPHGNGIGVGAVLASYQAKKSVVINWNKRNRHWTNTYQSIMDLSVPR